MRPVPATLACKQHPELTGAWLTPWKESFRVHKTVKVLSVSFSDAPFLGYCSYHGIQQQLRISQDLPMTSWWAAGCRSMLFNQVHNIAVCTVPCSCVFIHSRPCPTNPQPSQYYHREIMGECVRDGFAGPEENLEWTRTKQSILKNEEAFQPVLAWCLPPSPCRDCTGLVESLPCWADSGQLLHLQGNTLKEVRRTKNVVFWQLQEILTL